ncbi:MAG TPA: DegV family protein [Acidimicrobiales bacterium]|nr:DegV family protein [Acidimicrobiales bacterium]
MSVCVVTDSACSLPPELAASHGVVVVPMRVAAGDRVWPDGAVGPGTGTLTTGTLTTGTLTTSCPSPGELVELYHGLGAEDVLVLTVSRRMSAMFESATLAARLVAGCHVRVFDTGTAAGAQGLVALAAARCARQGGSLDEVETAARRCADRVRLVATLPSLASLARSGRVPQAAAWAGTWLGLNPLFEFRSGRAVPLRPVRGRHQALDRLVSIWRSSTDAHREEMLHICAMHALEPGVADDLMARVSMDVHPTSSFVASFSAVMVAHTGTGLAGLAWWWEPVGAPGRSGA